VPRVVNAGSAQPAYSGAHAVTKNHHPPANRPRPELDDLGFDLGPVRARDEVRRRLPHVTDEQFLLVVGQHYGESTERLVARVAQAWPHHEEAHGLASGKHYATVQRAVDSLLGEGNLAPTLGEVASRLGIHRATLRRWRLDDPSIEDLVR
jgi:hypothetical protein